MLPDNRDFYIEYLSEQRSPGMSSSHIHDYYEIFYLVEGKRRYFINHTLYDVDPGNIILVNKRDVHKALPITQNSAYGRYLLTFSEKFVDSLKACFDTDFLMHCFSSKKLNIPENMRHSFDSLLHKTYMRSQSDSTSSHYLAKLGFIELLVNINKQADTTVSLLSDDITSYEDRIQEACRYICNYYNKPISLESIAKVAYMSPTYFSKKFKKVTGMGFIEYLNNIRIKMATELLMETQFSITEIAIFCGYQDSNYFSDVFRKITGVSPRTYRKEHYCS